MAALKPSDPTTPTVDLKERSASLRARASVPREVAAQQEDRPDPFLAALQVARTANDAVGAFERRLAEHRPEGWFREEAALVAEQARTCDLALATVPTTRVGQIALLDYLSELVGQHGYANGDPPDDESEVWRLAYRATSAALRAPVPSEGGSGHDLSACTIKQLARLYETWNGIHEHIIAAGAIPCFWQGDERGDYTPAGDILDREYDRSARILDTIADEARQRQPASREERFARLEVLIRQEMNGNGEIADRALRAELIASWGAR